MISCGRTSAGMHWPSTRSRNSATAPTLATTSSAIERRCDSMLTWPLARVGRRSCVGARAQLLEVIRCRIMERHRAIGCAAHELVHRFGLFLADLRRAALGHHLALS